MSFTEVLKNLNWSYLTDLLISVIPALVCITIHECCHGIAAYALGDETAKTDGRISLNPLHHIDPVGLLMLVLFKFGWARPVSVDARHFKNPKAGMAITALAGPASNFVLAALVMLIRALCTVGSYGFQVRLLSLLDTTAYLSIGLGLFNLIPVPPLDGSKVLFSFLSDRAYMTLMRYEKYGMIIMMILAFSGVISGPLGRATQTVFAGMFDLIVKNVYYLIMR